MKIDNISKCAHSFLLLSGLLLTLSFSNCKKYLEAKSDKKLVIPSTLNDLQAILDNYGALTYVNPAAGEVSTNDYYLTDADYNGLYYESDRRMYTWQKDFVFEPGDQGNEWESCYTAIYAANSVLYGLLSITRSPVNAVDLDNIKGQALLHRANRFLGALQVWAPAFDANSAATDLGIPLRLDPDFNQGSVRATLAESYAQVIADLRDAIPLLPTASISPMRPSKPAAYALLARTYLYTGDYDRAGLYADSCLQIKKDLLDLNTLNPLSAYPIPDQNTEVIFYQGLTTAPPVYNARAKIDPGLYNLYDENDLRKTLFFKNNNNGTFAFRGSYTASYVLLGGPATDEMYLIRAECSARKGMTAAALNDLNTLLIKRYKAGSFVPLAASNAVDALNLVLLERRKELLMRGLRWSDIKRLNKQGANISLTRTVSGITYTLPPNDPRFALPIPEDVISKSGMPQNPR